MQNNNCLEELQKNTIIVADTGDINTIKRLKPQDATTNPSLLVKASEQQEYSYLLNEAIEYAKQKTDLNTEEKLELAMDKLNVSFGSEILKHVDGYVSTEVNAHLSFDTEKSIECGRRIIKMYEEIGIPKERVLIKIAATWEGILAAKQLESEGITCNLTLIFTFAQALACAEAGVTLISPFVGRITDGHVKKYGKTFTPDEEPGVLLVHKIFNYYKKFGYKTIVMAASLRNPEQVLALAGVDRITMPPTIIEKLSAMTEYQGTKLTIEHALKSEINKLAISEKSFRWLLNEDEVGNEKLADGIRVFAKDYRKLQNILQAKLN